MAFRKNSVHYIEYKDDPALDYANRNQQHSLPEWRFPIDKEKKEQSLTVIQQEAANKRIRYYPAFMEHVWNQMRFQSPAHWLLQGCILLTSMLLAIYLRRKNIWNLEMLTVCSVFFVFAGNICLSQVARLFSWHMAELEQTLYLDLKQMVCIRMLEAGIADVVILTIFFGITGEVNTMGISETLIYMLTPFLWSDIFYLYMLAHFRSIFSVFWSFALGLLCCITALFPVVWDLAYQPEYLIVWQVLAAAGVILLIAEIMNFLGKIEQGDNICED